MRDDSQNYHVHFLSHISATLVRHLHDVFLLVEVLHSGMSNLVAHVLFVSQTRSMLIIFISMRWCDEGVVKFAIVWGIVTASSGSGRCHHGAVFLSIVCCFFDSYHQLPHWRVRF